MNKPAHIIYILAFAFIALGPLSLLLADAGSLVLPSWLTSEDAKYLSGSVSKANVHENITPDGFTSKKLQSSIETDIENHIPLKAIGMLANAEAQRSTIAIANIPFGFECYPTYYGSARLHVPAQNAVTYIPQKRSSDRLKAVRTLGKSISKIARRNPKVRFSLIIAQGYHEPGYSPARSLVTDVELPDEYLDVAKRGMSNASNAFAFSETYKDAGAQNYFRDYFRTDHHWNWHGIARAYNTVATELDLAPFESPSESTIEGYEYTGATARWGLDMITEKVSDTDYPFPNLQMEADDGMLVPYNHNAFYSRSDPGKKHAFYDSYHHSPPILLGPGDSNALIVSDSFGNGIAPYIAQNYRETHFIEHLHSSHRDPDARLQALIDEYGTDDVFIVASPGDLADFAKACPLYFS